jgi:hypothetical protein
MATVAALALLAACGQPQNTETTTTATTSTEAAAIVPWSSISPADLKVPQGVSYTTTSANGEVVADISAVPPSAGAGGYTGGVAVPMTAAFEDAASGHQIRVTVRASSPTPGASLGVAYSTDDVGNSGWHQFALTQAPQNYSFTYAVPTKVRGGGDFLGFRSFGDAHVQIAGYQVEVVRTTP